MSEIFYDAEAASQFIPTEKGVYPAHVTKVTKRDVKTRDGYSASVFTLHYKVAAEAKKIKQQLWEMDGYKYKSDEEGNRIPVMKGKKQQEVECEHLVGKEFRDRGTFLFTDIPTSNSGRNRRYKELIDTLDLPLNKVEKDGKTLFSLPILDDGNLSIVGIPVLINMDEEEWKNKDGEKRTSMKVFSIQPWKDGEKISEEELTSDEEVPF